MKRIAVIVSLLCMCSVAQAGSPRFSYGMEWGYTGSILKTHQYNYIYSAGSRIIDYWPPDLAYYSNGSFLLNAGADISDNFNLSLYSGLVGVWSDRWMVPVELRLRWSPGGLNRDGQIYHVGTDLTFPTTPSYLSSLRLHLGGGYRFMVFRDISVDFLLSMSITGDHDLIIDPDLGYHIPMNDITYNFSEYWGLNFSIALNF